MTEHADHHSSPRSIMTTCNTGIASATSASTKPWTCDARTFSARRPGDRGGEVNRLLIPIESYQVLPGTIKSYLVLSSPTWYYKVLSSIVKSRQSHQLSSPSCTAVLPLSPKRKEHTLHQHLGTLTQSPPALRQQIRPSSPELAQHSRTDKQLTLQTIPRTAERPDSGTFCRDQRRRGGQDRV